MGVVASKQILAAGVATVLAKVALPPGPAAMAASASQWAACCGQVAAQALCLEQAVRDIAEREGGRLAGARCCAEEGGRGQVFF